MATGNQPINLIGLNEETAEKLAKEYEVGPATIRRDGQFARLLDTVLQQANMEDKRWELLGGDVHLNRGAVKKLSALKGKALTKQLEYLLQHGKLPRAVRSDSAASVTAKTRATALVNSLKSKDEKLPVAVLKEMATMLGFKLTAVESKK